jgi:hypothetical protein
VTEAERLQKIILAQEKEIARLRKLLQTARCARVEYGGDGNVLQIVVTAVGSDEFYFIEQVRKELMAIGDAIMGEKGAVQDLGGTNDMTTGEPVQGGVSPQPPPIAMDESTAKERANV